MNSGSFSPEEPSNPIRRAKKFSPYRNLYRVLYHIPRPQGLLLILAATGRWHDVRVRLLHWGRGRGHDYAV